MADSYLDVPLSAMSYYSGKFTETKKKNLFSKSAVSTRKDENTSINVDFSAQVPAGTFCYVICLYDAQGNISQPSEVCVTVESWGGNINLVGDWGYTKQVENGHVVIAGEESCSEHMGQTLYCDSGITKEVTFINCTSIDALDMTFKSDGTYTYYVDSVDKNLDYEASQASCELVYLDNRYVYTSKGNWAFNEEESKLTLVEFEYSFTEDGIVETEMNVEGELVLEGKIELTANSFVLTETYTYQEEVDVYEYYLNKK